jgi:uncharacterized protein YxeA
MKKNIIAIIAIITLITTSIVGCGNMSLGAGKYKYEKIHVDTEHYSGCLPIDKWYENSIGIEVKATNYGHMYLSEGTYILVEDKCPLCD